MIREKLIFFFISVIIFQFCLERSFFHKIFSFAWPNLSYIFKNSEFDIENLTTKQELYNFGGRSNNQHVKFASVYSYIKMWRADEIFLKIQQLVWKVFDYEHHTFIKLK